MALKNHSAPLTPPTAANAPDQPHMLEDPKLPIVATVTYRGHEIGVSQHFGNPVTYVRKNQEFAMSIEEMFKLIDTELANAHLLIGKTVAVHGTAFIGKEQFDIVVPGIIKQFNEGRSSTRYVAEITEKRPLSVPAKVSLYPDPWEKFTEWTPEHQQAYDAFLEALDAYTAASAPLLQKCHEAAEAMNPLIKTSYLNAF